MLLCARSEIVVDGTLVSNGQGAKEGGGGSGGSVLLIAPTVSGTGTLVARGGTANNGSCVITGYSGGGGRVTVLSPNSSIVQSQVEVQGGGKGCGTKNGALGTWYSSSIPSTASPPNCN